MAEVSSSSVPISQEINQNNKRPLDSQDEPMCDASNEQQNIQQQQEGVGGEQSDADKKLAARLRRMEKHRKFLAARKAARANKKQRTGPRFPTYRVGIHPALELSGAHPRLEFTFDVDTSVMGQVKYICQTSVKVRKTVVNKSQQPAETTDATSTTVDVKQELDGDVKMEEAGQNEEFVEMQFVTDGYSKKDAKRKLCYIILSKLYSDTYQPPQDMIDQYLCQGAYEKQPRVPKSVQNAAAVVGNENAAPVIPKNDPAYRARIAKICAATAKLQFKNPSQLLNEIAIKIAETAECISETGIATEKKFAFRIVNALVDPNIVGGTDSPDYVAYGFGRNKKEAKTDASKNALKQFFDFDLDQVLSAAKMLSTSTNSTEPMNTQPNAQQQ